MSSLIEIRARIGNLFGEPQKTSFFPQVSTYPEGLPKMQGNERPYLPVDNGFIIAGWKTANTRMPVAVNTQFVDMGKPRVVVAMNPTSVGHHLPEDAALVVMKDHTLTIAIADEVTDVANSEGIIRRGTAGQFSDNLLRELIDQIDLNTYMDPRNGVWRRAYERVSKDFPNELSTLQVIQCRLIGRNQYKVITAIMGGRAENGETTGPTLIVQSPKEALLASAPPATRGIHPEQITVVQYPTITVGEDGLRLILATDGFGGAWQRGDQVAKIPAALEEVVPRTGVAPLKKITQYLADYRRNGHDGNDDTTLIVADLPFVSY